MPIKITILFRGTPARFSQNFCGRKKTKLASVLRSVPKTQASYVFFSSVKVLREFRNSLIDVLYNRTQLTKSELS